MKRALKRLIIAEKNAAAVKIAAILSKGAHKREFVEKVPAYHFTTEGIEHIVLGLRGHIVGWDYPKEFSSWTKVNPKELVWAEPERSVTEGRIVRALRALAGDAQEVVIATDYDREGELIGVEALEIITEVNPSIKVRRVRFSALTPAEVGTAFSQPVEVDNPLARSAESRQLIDLAWGATLTRFVSRAANQVWQDYLSIGRVQSPTLALVVEKEEEIQAFEARPFWSVQATFEKDETFTGEHEHGRFWEKDEAEAVTAKLEGARVASVAAYNETEKRDRPPAPFNTTAFLAQATRIGLSAYRAMSVAEDLYNSGFISYPRTDNTVYPKSLDLRGILQRLENSGLGDEVRRLEREMRPRPTRGKKEATDHPPIHPVEAATRAKLKGDRWKVYELVVRRFMATMAPDALIRSSSATLDIRGERFTASGQNILKAGWRSYYPYITLREVTLPVLQEGEEVTVLQIEMVQGETQPPPRYSQGTLIQQMEKLGLGTKSTRHETIQKLYDRRYVQGDPIQPTPSGRSLISALKEHAQEITESKMTALLEEEMDAIANGRKGLEEVVKESREMLEDSVVTLQKHEEAIGRQIKAALREQRVLGTCLKCGKPLVIRRSRRGRRRPFVGCEGYPECTVTYSLPSRGMIEPAGKNCEACSVPMVRVTYGRKTEDQCINEECEVFLRRNRVGVCPSCGQDLVIRHSRNHKRFVGCRGYPECRVTYPLPQRGRIQPLRKVCSSCGLPTVRVFSGRRPWDTCLNMECPSRTRKPQASKGS